MAKPAARSGRQRPGQSAQGRRRLPATGPEDAALRPEAEPIEAQIEGIGANPAGDFLQAAEVGPVSPSR
jgi:hypothetical protein